MKTREEHIQFIRLNLTALVACAWTGFVAKGRGLVCVLSDQHDESTRMVPFDFMPEKEASKLIKPWYGTKEARMVTGYDPQIEVIIGFVRSHGNKLTFDCYRLKSNPAPPDAAEME